jgi:hypothetical protein
MGGREEERKEPHPSSLGEATEGGKEPHYEIVSHTLREKVESLSLEERDKSFPISSLGKSWVFLNFYFYFYYYYLFLCLL